MSADKQTVHGTKLSLGSILHSNMKRFRNRIAQYEDETGCVDTYGALLTRSVRIALKLNELGVVEDDIVSTYSHTHKNSCVPFLASIFIGAVPCAFYCDLPQSETIALIRLMEPKIMFVSEETLGYIEVCIEEANVKPTIIVFETHKGKYMRFDDLLEPQVNERQFKVYETNDPKKTAVIVFSTGTTGLPKGVCLNHYALIELNTNKHDVIREDLDSVVYGYSNLHWISGVSFLIQNTVRGAASVIYREFDPQRFWETVEKYKVSKVYLKTADLTELLPERRKIDELDVSSIKRVITGGVPMTTKKMLEVQAAFPGVFIENVYGSTEMGAVSCLNRVEDEHLLKEKPTTCGKILSHHQWKIVDLETEERVSGPYKKGELRLKNERMMNGYYKMDPSDAFDSEGYFKMGDIVHYDEDNCLFLSGRIKEVFKYRTWQIFPAIVEEVLMGHPAVKDAAVLGIPHPEDTNHPLGLVVLKNGFENVTAQEIRQYADERLIDPEKLRAGVKIVDKLLRSAAGKVKKKGSCGNDIK